MHELREIRVYRLRLPLSRPYRLSFAAVEHYDTIVAELTDDEGRCALGEATVLTGYTDETIDESWAAACAFARRMAEIGLAKARLEVEQLGARLPFTATAFGTAIEMWVGSPWLDVAVATPVPILGLLHASDEAAIAREFEELLAAGYRTIKVKIGFDAEHDARIVRAVQNVARGRAAIRLDANQGYTREQGIAFVRSLAPEDIELFEQPCAAADWESHLAVARASPVPMMLDESIYGLGDIERAARTQAAAYVKVKLMKFITLEHLADSIKRIRELGMTPVLGNGVATDLGCWMEGCIAARLIDNAGEMNGFLKPRAPLLAPALEFRAGALWLSPGYRPRLDPETMQRHVIGRAVIPFRGEGAMARGLAG